MTEESDKPFERVLGYIAEVTGITHGIPEPVSAHEPTYAISASQWNIIKDTVVPIPVADDDTCLLQIWRYDPAVLSNDRAVDPYSLWLSLRGSVDERVQSALEQLLGGLLMSAIFLLA